MTPELYKRVQRLSEGFEGRCVELGSRPADGQEDMSIKPLFPVHVGLDLEAGPCVDIQADISRPDVDLPELKTADLVLCLETLEHILHFWSVLKQFGRMKRGAVLMVSVPYFDFHYHAHPVDCYRFSHDALPALMEGFDIIESGYLPDTIGQKTLYAIGVKQ